MQCSHPASLIAHLHMNYMTPQLVYLARRERANCTHAVELHRQRHDATNHRKAQARDAVDMRGNHLRGT
eukprot:8173652-Pyramimonas_sp.AAC.1